MAIYVPQARRRRRLIIVAVLALVLGAVGGVLVGRLTAPTEADGVTAAQEQARQVTSQLRVVSLHAESGAASLGSDGDAGAGLALQRADTDLGQALAQAPWIPTDSGSTLRNRLQQLQRTASSGAATTAAFGTNVDSLAADIDGAFGLAAHT